MTTQKKKAGRKPKSFKTWDNKTIDGLLHETDGRWKIVATGKRFSEPDERLAVAKFFELTGAAPAANAILLPTTDPKKYGKKVANELTGYDGLSAGTQPIVAVDEIQFWARVRREILTRAKWVAEQVGIEEIGYLTNLKKPERLPSFDELETIWTQHAKCAADQKQKVLRSWQDFRKTSQVTAINEITPEVVVAFQDAVHGRELSGKQQAHIFAGTRRMLSFAKSRAIAIVPITTALTYLSILTPSISATTLDPMPIEPADFKKMLAKATGEDKAMILLMLNCAMYLQEVIRLEWSDIKDGCITTNRMKTGECIRVAVLWPETLEALAQLPRKRTEIFVNFAGAALGRRGASQRFNKLRLKAEVSKTVTGSHLRDGAYTAAVQANVTTALCQLLVGHRSGMADHYVKRNPKMVGPACEAKHANKWFVTGEMDRRFATITGSTQSGILMPSDVMAPITPSAPNVFRDALAAYGIKESAGRGSALDEFGKTIKGAGAVMGKGFLNEVAKIGEEVNKSNEAAHKRAVEEQKKAAAEKVKIEKEAAAESARAWKKEQEDAARLIEQSLTPLQRYQEEVARIQELFNENLLTSSQAGAAIDKAAKGIEDKDTGDKKASFETRRFDFRMPSQPQKEDKAAELAQTAKDQLESNKQTEYYLQQLWLIGEDGKSDADIIVGL